MRHPMRKITHSFNLKIADTHFPLLQVPLNAAFLADVSILSIAIIVCQSTCFFAYYLSSCLYQRPSCLSITNHLSLRIQGIKTMISQPPPPLNETRGIGNLHLWRGGTKPDYSLTLNVKLLSLSRCSKGAQPDKEVQNYMFLAFAFMP